MMTPLPDRAPDIQRILNSPKYRMLGIPPETVADLFAQEEGKHPNEKTLQKAVRQKLHNIMAVYLGDPDYNQAADALTTAWREGGMNALKLVCRQLLNAHASTRERLPQMDTFYNEIFALTGKPNVVLDLACALHPFGLPWMKLPAGCSYYAYDIHAPRIALIRASTISEKYSGARNCSAIAPNAGEATAMMSVATVPANSEPMAAIASAAPARPLRAI